MIAVLKLTFYVLGCACNLHQSSLLHKQKIIKDMTVLSET